MAERRFANRDVYLERLVEQPRHVEIQLLGDRHGRLVHLFERDCSVQRRHQKIIEEARAPNVDRSAMQTLLDRVAATMQRLGYDNLGTVEMLLGADGEFYFLEMNTRLQVEHPVTEMVTGLDLVIAQLDIAGGQPLPWTQDAIRQRGAAIEVRVYAEDPAKNFLPSPGTISRLLRPSGEGIRVESGVVEGSVVSVHYDPLLFKLPPPGADRAEAIVRAREAGLGQSP
jgi:acetyl-CoA carboxylase biotin carboxylase subunit